MATTSPKVEAALPPVDPSRVFVLADANAVADEVFQRVDDAAKTAIAERGHFALAIPGGSVLKMLAGRHPKWADKCTLAYVNHKCVAMDDEELATHAKAVKLFLGSWEGASPVVLSGSGDAAREAELYQSELASLPDAVLPRDESGLPQFDMVVLGVGDDGHVGSLYPGREEPLVEGSEQWILPVEMKTPGSITFSLPLMSAGKNVLVAACGVSDKYPMGKSDAMKQAIEGAETIASFPGAGVRAVAEWIIDEAAGSKLSAEYASSVAVAPPVAAASEPAPSSEGKSSKGETSEVPKAQEAGKPRRKSSKKGPSTGFSPKAKGKKGGRVKASSSPSPAPEPAGPEAVASEKPASTSSSTEKTPKPKKTKEPSAEGKKEPRGKSSTKSDTAQTPPPPSPAPAPEPAPELSQLEKTRALVLGK